MPLLLGLSWRPVVEMALPDESWRPTLARPKQHFDNGVAKNNAAGRRYKRLVRALKNLENEMCDKGVIKAAPGHFAECLVFNVPNDKFGHTRYDDDMQGVLAFLWNNTRTADDCNEFVEVNELKWLFRGPQK